MHWVLHIQSQDGFFRDEIRNLSKAISKELFLQVWNDKYKSLVT